MVDNKDQINRLENKLNILLDKQEYFIKEIYNLKIEIAKLKSSKPHQTVKKESSIVDVKSEKRKEKEIVTRKEYQQHRQQEHHKKLVKTKTKSPKDKSDMEKFIGENLISKIGIAITIIGVGIGAKYSIEHDLISPLTRIILGYLSGLILLGFGIKLKKNYKNYSAVLVSGAMAIMYFITYFAFSFYNLIPHFAAFALMIIFTVFTVIAAINYNNQVIAHIGLVGAYAVPFLLSQDAGNIAILFTYMAIINVGILIIAFKKYWKKLYYSSFIITWLIYNSWYIFNYQPSEDFSMALIFSSIFFSIFYFVFISYKLREKEKFEIGDIFLLLFNSFIFYGIGYFTLKNHELGARLLGVFTIVNACIHFMVSLIIYKQKFTNRNLFFLTSGLGLVFVTIAIPVQLNGNWVTMLWAGEAALLFWVGRTKKTPTYEQLSYPLMILSFLSIIHDWISVYNFSSVELSNNQITPIFNVTFLTSFIFIAAFSFMSVINYNNYNKNASEIQKSGANVVSFLIYGILLVSLYYAFRLEIENYYQQLYADSFITINEEGKEYPTVYKNYDLIGFKIIWVINYSLLFVSLLAFVNMKKLKNQQLGIINLVFIVLVIIIFLFQGLLQLSELRNNYLEQTLSQFYNRNVFNIGIRYISFAFVALTFVTCYKYIKQDFIKKDYKIPFDFLLHVSILWIASSELINWLEIAETKYTYKLGLSILWGAYSLFLIAMGIWKKKKYLRIGAIALFGVTLIKLFFYDISHLNTISKTIVFVSLGLLLLIISFLYNKYKNVISGESPN